MSVQPTGQSWEKALVHQKLFGGEGIQTTQGERASLGFNDGTVLQMDHRTVATLRDHVTVVYKGQVAEYLQPGTKHEVQVNGTVCAANGTTFDVASDGATATFVVLHGALLVQSSAGAVLVKAGDQTSVAGNRAPEPPTPADTRAVFAWTSGIPTPDLGEDLSLDANGGHIVAFSSQREGPGDTGHAAHIIDGLLTEGWESAQGQVSNQSITVGFLGGNPYRIVSVIIDPAATYGDPASEDLKDFEIRVSVTGTDAGSFTTIFHGTCLQKDALQKFSFPVPVRAKYVQLVALNNYGSPDLVAVAEWEVVANESLFGDPGGVALDRQGNIYVADAGADRIDKLSPKGKLLTSWGSKGDAPGQFNQPEGVAVAPNGDIFVADTMNCRVERLSPTGQVLAVFGSEGWAAGQFAFPQGIAVDSGGTVYVADTYNYRVQRFDSSGKVLGAVQLQFRDLPVDPEGFALGSGGRMWVTGSDSGVYEFSPSGKAIASYGTSGAQTGLFFGPKGIAVSAKGVVIVADWGHNRLVRVSPSGTITKIGSFGLGRGHFALPYGVAFDHAGNAYVSEGYSDRIQKLSPTGTVRAVWGKFGTVPQLLGEPGGIAVDNRGDV